MRSAGNSVPSSSLTPASVISFDLPAFQLDLAIDDELARADVDVVARAAAQIFHEEARAVGAPVVPEARLFEARVEVRVALLHLLIERDLELVQDAIRDRGEDEIGPMVVNTGLHRLLGIERAQGRSPSAYLSARCGSTSAAPSSRRRRSPTAPLRCRGRNCSSR